MRAAPIAMVIAATTLVGCAATADSETDATAVEKNQVMVYVAKEISGHDKLHAHAVPVAGEPAVESAVEALTTYKPTEPFYTIWDGFCSLGEGLDQVTVTEDLITVHFNQGSGATCDMSHEGWQIRRQQLAWTVRTATGSAAPVRVTVGDDRYQADEAAVANEKYLAHRTVAEHTSTERGRVLIDPGPLPHRP